MSKASTFDSTQQTYAAEMAKFNNNQNHFFSHQLCSLIGDLEVMDRQRSQVTVDLLSKCADIGAGLAKNFNDAATSLRRTASRINPEEVSSFLCLIGSLTFIVYQCRFIAVHESISMVAYASNYASIIVDWHLLDVSMRASAFLCKAGTFAAPCRGLFT